MKNWKTTLTGAAIAAAIVVLQLVQTGTVDAKSLITAGAFALLGAISKDFNTTGGTVAATPEAQNRIDANAPK